MLLSPVHSISQQQLELLGWNPRRKLKEFRSKLKNLDREIGADKLVSFCRTEGFGGRIGARKVWRTFVAEHDRRTTRTRQVRSNFSAGSSELRAEVHRLWSFESLEELEEVCSSTSINHFISWCLMFLFLQFEFGEQQLDFTLRTDGSAESDQPVSELQQGHDVVARELCTDHRHLAEDRGLTYWVTNFVSSFL